MKVPQTRDGDFYPSILEGYQRSEKALILALAEAYIQGVFTRKMKKITEELLGVEFSMATISRYMEELDGELYVWRNRALSEEEYPYVILDARYDKCRASGEIVDIAVMVAIGIGTRGYRRFLGLEVCWGETLASWDSFVKGLKERGLKGVRLFTSDDHTGIRNAIRKYFPGAQWQRCQRHFLINAMDKVPGRERERVHDELNDVCSSSTWDQARGRLEKMAERWSVEYEELSNFISEEGLDTLTVYKACPREHRRKMRTNNIVERANQEFKRRGRVVRIFPNVKSCLRLYGAIAKEWDEDWFSGGKYMDMEPLWRWEKEKASRDEELVPHPSEYSEEKKKITVVN